jgi:DNA-directed RNA polymerase specialized sigma24 family protein
MPGRTLTQRWACGCTVLKMHFEEGLDYATMSEILDETPAAMRKRVSDGLRYLRRIVDIPEN